MQKTNSSALGQFNWFDGQRLTFVIFFLAGAIAVITLKETGFGPFITIACSFLIMSLYIAYCGTRPYAIRAEIIGDNIYYLGFLFTLVSLAYTLYKFTSSDTEIDQIIKNFGIALSTTLIGVVGRVYFNQTSDEEEGDGIDAGVEAGIDTESLLEQERQLSVSLSERTHLLITEMDEMQAQLVKLKNETMLSIQNTTETSMASFVQNLEKIRTLHAQEAEQDRKHQIAAQALFSQSVEASSVALNALADKVSQSTQAISSDVQASLQHYTALNQEIRTETQASRGAIEALQGSLTRLTSLGGADKSGKN